MRSSARVAAMRRKHGRAPEEMAMALMVCLPSLELSEEESRWSIDQVGGME
jgi:hypothetical protein